ncbi:DUF1801 domain-containing protein [Acidovorax sp. sif1233]|uniref:DUF1801 domain-containing protein n=1 Tax=unclassified Acidovorax TaxID=2684926 RepID=UPI001C45F382|nr:MULTISPECIES: DUF1801 domain-containing protein [unclassified Acidovorax]MBV7429971.1 DUF1801 domain-containing protein [Acidovorax sp. sif0732]MBV7451364.1 DUF1801 domain-containing protein [Acidovorax sp. sif0715]MBV7454446.1 DUF1801 domain-containing protein [Acidovorax sp. sif1233]
MPSTSTTNNQPASTLIDQRIADLADWRGRALARMRQLIHEAAPGVVEEWKWMGTPVWSLGGILCTGESYKASVKLTFLKGASLPDPARLFNASLDGNARRAIDIHEGDEVDADAFKALIRAAVELNAARPAGRKPAARAKAK